MEEGKKLQAIVFCATIVFTIIIVKTVFLSIKSIWILEKHEKGMNSR